MAGKRRIDELKLSSEQQEKLIELYQSETYLWNVSSPTYSNKISVTFVVFMGKFCH